MNLVNDFTLNTSVLSVTSIDPAKRASVSAKYDGLHKRTFAINIRRLGNSCYLLITRRTEECYDHL
jgi:hypothetical protein